MKKFFALLCLACWSLLDGEMAVAVQKQVEVYRVGVLYLGKKDNPHANGLIAGLQDRGYVEGKNLVLNITQARTLEEMRSTSQEFKRGSMNVIIIQGGRNSRIVGQVLQDVPIIFAPAADPVASGLVKSLAHPQTNFTGLTYVKNSEMYGKFLEMFKEVVPTLRRVLVLYDGSDDTVITKFLPIVRKTAGLLGLELAENSVKSIIEAERVIASSLTRNTTDGVFPICRSFFNDLTKIAADSNDRGIALFGCSAHQVAEDGALLTYAPDFYYIGYRAAWYVDKILRGAQPQDLPVETPTRYELVISLRTAKRLNLKIPPEVLIRADKVIR